MEYGKFASAEELLKGYNELEKSFTQKCQQLSQLRNQMSTNSDGTNEASSPSQQTEENDGAAAEVQAACAVPADNDASSAASDSQASPISPLPKVMTSGGNLSLAAPTKPRTIKEASVLAIEFFKN